MGTLRIRGHVPSVFFDRKQGILFLLSFLSVDVDDPPMTSVMDEQEICPCPSLCSCPYLPPFRRKSKPVHWLVPAVHLLRGQDRCSKCQLEEQLRPIQLHIIQSNT